MIRHSLATSAVVAVVVVLVAWNVEIGVSEDGRWERHRWEKKILSAAWLFSYPLKQHRRIEELMSGNDVAHGERTG